MRGHDLSPHRELSLLDLLLVIARNKTLVLRTILAFALLGGTYALLASNEYTSTARVVREAQKDGVNLPAGLPTGALSGLGINLGGTSSGLTAQAFPDVLRSREVRLGVIRDTFSVPGAKRPMTYVEYANQPPGLIGMVLKYTIRLPFTAWETVSDAVSGPPVPAGTTRAGEPVVPSERENRALERIDNMVSSTVDEESGLMTISVTAEDPQLAADLARSFVEHLRERVRSIRTEKVRERLQFVKTRFEEVERELETAEDRLAQFLERNQNPTTASLQFRRDRLQRQVRFKEQLYSELQSQLTQTRIDLQRRQPVVTVVEEPVPPLQKSAPQRVLIVIMSLLLGGIVGVGVAFVRSRLVDRSDDPEDQEKIEEIRSALVPEQLVKRVRSWAGDPRGEERGAGHKE